MLANYQDSFIRVRGRRVDVPAGSVARSQITLAERWHWSRGKVRRFLAELEQDQQITQITSHDFNVINICNYREYQQDISETVHETVHGVGHGVGHETVHIKETQQGKEGKETTVLGANDFNQPVTAIQWANVFVSTHGYSMAEAQSVSTMPMYGRWIGAGVSRLDVENAMLVAKAKIGQRPGTPKFLEKIVAALQASTGPSMPANHGGFDQQDYTTGKFAQRMQKAGGGS